MSRIATVKERMVKDQIDGLVVSDGSDIKYLTGFTGEYGISVLLLTAGKDYFITDGRFQFQAKDEVPECEVVIMSGQQRTYYDATADLLKDLSLKRVAVQEGQITHSDYVRLINGNDRSEFIAAPAYLAELRRVKTDEELLLIKEACRISERSFYALLDFIKPGVTEIEIANELERQFRNRGGSGYCFDTIVASGPVNGANCHATPSQRKIEVGDFVTLDFGTGYQGYCSDMTRTVAIGQPRDKEQLKIYETVKKAKQAGAAILKAGLGVAEIDKVVREIVDQGGYSIPHGIGHGFGLDIHEDPFIGGKNPYQLEENVVITIEPGIYVPGVCGVRIEDDYLIGKDGAECLQQVTNELIIL